MPSRSPCLYHAKPKQSDKSGFGWCAKTGHVLSYDECADCGEYKPRGPICPSQDLAEGSNEQLFREAEQCLNDLHKLLRTLYVRATRADLTRS